MFLFHARLPALDNDHWTTDTATIASNIDCTMVVIDVHAHKFAEPPSTAEGPEVRHKPRGIPSETDNCAVHVDNEGVSTIYLRSCSQTYVYNVKAGGRVGTACERKATKRNGRAADLQPRA